MKTYIVLHESMSVMETKNRTPGIVLKECFNTTDAEHSKIRNEYESRSGKYGMKNPSLDICWHVPDDYFN